MDDLLVLFLFLALEFEPVKVKLFTHGHSKQEIFIGKRFTMTGRI